MGSSHSRPKTTTKRTLSRLLFICGASSSTKDYADEVLVKAAEHCDLVADKFQIPQKKPIASSDIGYIRAGPQTEISGSSQSTVFEFGSDKPSVEYGPCHIEEIGKGKCLPGRSNLSPLHGIGIDYSGNRTSTSHADIPAAESEFVKGKADKDFVIRNDGIHDKDLPQTVLWIAQPSSSSPQEFGELLPDKIASENDRNELPIIHYSCSASASVVPDSPLTFNNLSDEASQEEVPSDREEGERDVVQHVDVDSISSNSLSASSTEFSRRELRWNHRRLLWDAFSRRNNGIQSDSRAFINSNNDIDDIGSLDRRLLDSGGQSFSDGLTADDLYSGSRTLRRYGRRRHSRSEIWQRLRVGIDARTNTCPSGIHSDGTCSCESTDDDSGSYASISRIVVLAEALFEVLDEIHRRPESLSLSMVSLPAPQSIVDSLPVKFHINKSKSGNDMEQCYICLAEYEEGDKLRVLPCRHEYHMSCVDKWLKEIHGVCPLCRGHVRDMEAFVSSPEIPSA